MASTSKDSHHQRHSAGTEHTSSVLPGTSTDQTDNMTDTQSTPHQLDFYQAMADFKHMFPNMDEEVIEAVLRSNNGSVDATIDQLLTMGVDIEGPLAGHSRLAAARGLNSKAASNSVAPPPYSLGFPEPPPSYQECAASVRPKNSVLPSPAAAETKSPALNLPVVSDLLADDPCDDSDGSLRDSDLLGATGGQAFVSGGETIPKEPLPLGDIALVDPTPMNPPAAPVVPAAPVPKVPEKMPLFNHVYTPRQSLEPRRLFFNWKPPLLGPLPDDFLRLPPDFISPHTCGGLATPPALASPGPSGSAHRSIGHRTGSLPSPSLSPRPSSVRSASPSGDELSSRLLEQRMAENVRKRNSLPADLDPATAQLLEDERLALMLQNEEFLAELQGDEDFMHALERDRMNATAFEPPTIESPELDHNRPKSDFMEGYGDDRDKDMGAFPFDRSVSGDKHTEFRRQLKNMGGSSRKKFVDAARGFFSRKRKSPKQMYPYPGHDRFRQLEGYNSLRNRGSMTADDFTTVSSSTGYDQQDNSPPAAEVAVPDYKLLQRPMYCPDMVTSFPSHDNTERV